MDSLLAALQRHADKRDKEAHLSASSINKFLRCPRQWQEEYLRGVRGPASSALVIGSAVHLCLSRYMKGERPGNWWEDALAEYDQGVAWGKDSPAAASGIASRMIAEYWNTVGHHLEVETVEEEFSVYVSGVPVPVMGAIDLVTRPVGIDYKTTGYFRRNVKLNPEWKLAQGIYQLHHRKPSEIHVITRAKENPIVVPDSMDHPLYIGFVPKEQTEKIVRDAYNHMNYLFSTYGVEMDWPGSPTHDWAWKYCDLCRAGVGCEL